MGVAIRVTATGAEIRESRNTPDFDGRDGWICLSAKFGDNIDALRDLQRARVPEKYIVLDGRTPREATEAEKAAVDAALEDAKVIE